MQQPDAAKVERFIAESEQIRPRLYDYCVRLTGSLVDAEDVVQDSLAHAYFRLEIYKEDLSMKGWLYAIAKNKCIDHLRRKTLLRQRSTEFVDTEMSAETADDLSDEVIEAFSASIRLLPPRQRVALIMKDVLGLTAKEIAESLETTVESARSLVARARRELRNAEPGPVTLDGQDLKLMQSYVASFNAKDWDAVSSLLQADAACEVPNRFIGHGADSFRNSYFKRYSMRDDQWFCTLESIMSDQLVVVWSDTSGQVEPYGIMKLICDGEKVSRVVDYSHIGYVSEALRSYLSAQGITRDGPARLM